MDSRRSQHLARVRQLRSSFAEANERLVARLRAADEHAAETAPAGVWSAAQVGWHVAAVTTRFAGLIAGDRRGVDAMPEGFHERPWSEVLAGMPARLEASSAMTPPARVSRAEAISALESSGQRMARAFDALTPERGLRMGITHPITGAICVYQIGDWAIAHTLRHDAQATRVLS